MIADESTGPVREAARALPPGSARPRRRARAAETARERFERAVAGACDEAGVDFAARARLVVAVSGGVDSTALLLAMHALRRRDSVSPSLVACYVDHGLRERAEIERERDALADLCRHLNVPLECRSVDVAGCRRASRQSWEAAARRCRYTALSELAAREEAVAVLTGHTADDQVETVLLRALRGTGPRGLRGMAFVSRPWGPDGPALVRPLLALRRADTEAYCRALGVAWCEDSSNLSQRFLRNRVRHELVPVIEALSPGGTGALLRLVRQAAALDGWLEPLVEEQLARLWLRDGDRYRLRRPDAPLEPFMAGEVIASALARLLGTGAPSAGHVRNVTRLWTSSEQGRTDLPRGWHVEATDHGLSFTRTARVAPDAWRAERWPLREGMTVVPGWQVRISRDAASAPVTDDGRFVAFVAEPPGGLQQLSAGFWTPGERMRPAGMAGSKKLQDIFTDEKVPRAERRRIPLLYRDGECIWAVGVKRSIAAPPRPAGEGPTMRVSFRPLSSTSDHAG